MCNERQERAPDPDGQRPAIMKTGMQQREGPLLKQAPATQRPTRRFRTVADFLALPPSELRACLNGFHEWIVRAQELRASARRNGAAADGLDLTEFTWHARDEPSARRPAVPHSPTTDVRELGLRPSAMHKFRELNLYALEDFTQASEDELLRLPDVGPSSVAQIRSYLHAAGLDFRESSSPERRAHQAARIARLLPPQERDLSDDAPISSLGLKPATVGRCLRKGVTTIGGLRRLHLREIFERFGGQSVLELLETLECVGLELDSKPSQLEKWRFGAIRKERLQLPGDDAPLAELAPWLGAACGLLQRAGVKSVGDARALAAAGGRKVPGMGAHAWQRVFDHFRVHSTKLSDPAAADLPNAWLPGSAAK